MTSENSRVAIVTGGLGGLGSAVVGRLASERCSFSTGAAFDLSGGRAVY